MVIILVLTSCALILMTQAYRWLSKCATHVQSIAITQNSEFKNTPEVAQPVWLPIQGTLPSWLNGILFRVGPGRFILKNESDGNATVIRHAFDGMPFLHRFELSAASQSIRYNSRHLAVKAEQQIIQGYPNAFFGHISSSPSAWALLQGFLGRLNRFIIHPRLKAVFNKEVDPSSEMVGVTATPNYPLPRSFRSPLSSLSPSTPVLVTKTDANILQKVNSDSLIPEKLFNYSQFDPHLKGELAAAHHQYDPDTGETFNFVLKLGPVPKLIVFSTTASSSSSSRSPANSSNVTILAKITHRLDSSRTPICICYIHSFWLTKNYIIIPEAPLYLRNGGLDFMASGSFVSGMTWDNSSHTYLHVISRHPDQGHVATIPVDPFFTFHVGNAWEEYDHHDNEDSSVGDPVLLLDCAAFPDGDILYQVHSFGQSNPASNPQPSVSEKRKNQYGFTVPPSHQSSFGDLRRYRLTIRQAFGQSTISYTTLVHNLEFPQFHQEYRMKRYQYIYGNQLIPANSQEGERYNLVKVNLVAKETTVFDVSGYMCSEPIFVPRMTVNSDRDGDDAKREDDGVLLSFVNTVDQNQHGSQYCFLLILDASTMKEIARCFIGDFTATTFHGSFVDQEFKSIAIN